MYKDRGIYVHDVHIKFRENPLVASKVSAGRRTYTRTWYHCPHPLKSNHSL